MLSRCARLRFLLVRLGLDGVDFPVVVVAAVVVLSGQQSVAPVPPFCSYGDNLRTLDLNLNYALLPILWYGKSLTYTKESQKKSPLSLLFGAVDQSSIKPLQVH